MVNDPNITSQELASIKADTLVIAGIDDLVKKSHTKYIASQIENSSLDFVAGNHFVAKKNPIEFNKIVKNFLLK